MNDCYLLRNFTFFCIEKINVSSSVDFVGLMRKRGKSPKRFCSNSVELCCILYECYVLFFRFFCHPYYC